MKLTPELEAEDEEGGSDGLTKDCEENRFAKCGDVGGVITLTLTLKLWWWCVVLPKVGGGRECL